MIEVKFNISGLDTEVKLFDLDASLKCKEEILQAIRGEMWYNNTDFWINTIIYGGK